MDAVRFDPATRKVTTQWYCAFGRRPLIEVFVTAEGETECVRLTAKLDTVDGIEETVLPASVAQDGQQYTVNNDALPAPTEFNLVGELTVPASVKVRPFCVGIICLLTALWTEGLTLAQLQTAQHPYAEFFRHAMHVLGCDHPLAHAVSGGADPPDPRYNWF